MKSFRTGLLWAPIAALILLAVVPAVQAQESNSKKIRLLIVDGQNNHKNWPQTTVLMKGFLEETGLFSVDIATTPAEGELIDGFAPDFKAYKVVLLNYNGVDWPPATSAAFEKFVLGGGGVVSVHAADNAFPRWKAYNQMIGLGGWGDRTEKDGPYVYYNAAGKLVRDSAAGRGGSHGKFHAFRVKTRQTKHPITKGMPVEWMHAADELYDRLRGPAENMEVLTTAFSAADQNGTGRDEPMMMAIRYGKGRIFHTTLGHGNESQQCVGFITCLQRGAEWVATGKVTQPIPADFPGVDKPVIRK